MRLRPGNPLFAEESERTTLVESDLIERFRALLPTNRIRVGNAIPEGSTEDWSGEPAARPLAWLAPQTTEQVAAILRLCHAARIPVVPQGGLTGLAGGANPQAGAVALSLSAFNQIESIDPASATACVQAGVTLQDFQAACAAKGMLFGVDLAPRGSCQIGGMIATNAGGSGVIQYGTVRAQVLGLEVVLADGTILPMLRALPKNNSGYDLNQCFIGSEGTLGIVTRAILRLHPLPRARQTALIALPDFDAAQKLLQHLRNHFPDGIAAFELMWPDFVAAVQACVTLQFPFDRIPPLVALIDVTGQDAEAIYADLEQALTEALEQGWLEDATIASSLSQATQLWRLRESVPELFARREPINFDISLPIERSAEFVENCRGLLLTRWPKSDPLFFGHLGDGNLHIIVDANGLRSGESADDVSEAIYQLLPTFGGAISAEHGIGSLRRHQLRLCRTEQEIRAMRVLKRAFDPHNILNPGKILPDEQCRSTAI